MDALSIIIPAYNEEDAIEGVLKSCLAAREPLCRQAGFSWVEIIAVNDGSRDRTRELIGRFSEVKLQSHPVNKGYGAALMTGFQAARGDFLAFLDADGTCDPLAIAELHRVLKAQGADLCIGNRLHPQSRMPKIRELGNRFYAQLISQLSGVTVSDTASGMRLFKRDLLPILYSLPTGLHFTPAMTARAVCMGAKISETPIPYSARQGQSKLNVIIDGVRFLRVILSIIFAYYPLKIFGPLGILFGFIALVYGAGPVSYYLEHRRLEEDMIYRLLTILTLTVCGLITLAFGLVAQKAAQISLRRSSGWLDKPWVGIGAVALGFAFGLWGVLLNSKTILEYVSSGRITIHWIYVLSGGLAVISGTVLACFGITLGLVGHLQPMEQNRFAGVTKRNN